MNEGDRQMKPIPWVAGAMDVVIGIGTDIVTGFELTEADSGNL
jgi:hypothetical protein